VRIVLLLKAGDHHNLASFGRGSFYGELAFLDRHTRSANAKPPPTPICSLFPARDLTGCRWATCWSGQKMFARLARALSLRLRHTDADPSVFYA
jgi:sulfate permease, SulP family